MAGKMNKAVLLGTLLSLVSIACIASFILVLPSVSPKRVLPITPTATSAIDANLPFRGPQNIGMVIDGDSLRITWDKVPGAIGYNLYACELTADTTLYVPYAIYDFEKNAFIYRYSFHPRFGDVWTFADKADGRYQMKMWDKIGSTPWIKQNITPLVRNEYAIANAEAKETSLFYVTAVR